MKIEGRRIDADHASYDMWWRDRVLEHLMGLVYIRRRRGATGSAFVLRDSTPLGLVALVSGHYSWRSNRELVSGSKSLSTMSAVQPLFNGPLRPKALGKEVGVSTIAAKI